MKTKIIKKCAALICLLSVMLAFTSCTMFRDFKIMAEDGYASLNGKKVTIKSMGDPETDCLVYGYLDTLVFLHMYVQMDTSKEAIYTTPLAMGYHGSFCFPPFATGLSFQLVQLHQKGAFAVGVYSPGLGSEGNITFTTKKAGLHYIGAYNFKVEGSTGKITQYPRSEQSAYELKTLLKMKAQFKKTDWEALIDKRIEEIQNEKK